MDGVGAPTFGRYVVSGKVGEGSLGVVYRARHQELERDAAIKVLRPEVRNNAGAVAGMVAEAGTLAKLDHPNIVALYDFVNEPDRTWLAEQWVDGASLAEILDAHHRLTPEQALGVMAGSLSGLAHAHESGVVHRDVAASNVLADMAGTSMLVDFGLAAPVERTSGSGSAGVVGTPAYLSPEAARSEPVGKTGDVYSAAALTYHLLTGLPVFMGTAWEMVAAHRDQPAPGLANHGPRMASLLERSLSKDPSMRPPDAAAFLAELQEAAEEKYGTAWRTRSSIASLVGSTVGGTAAVAGSVASGAAPTVVASGLPPAPPAITGATNAVVSTGRRISTKVVLAAGATAAVVVTAVVVGITVTSGDDDKQAGPGDSPAESSSEPTLSEAELREQERQEKIEDLEAGVPLGVYEWRSPPTVNRLRNGSTSRDEPSNGTWRFPNVDCTPQRCAGTVKSSSGSTWNFQWDGASLSIKRPSFKTDRAACVDTATGEPVPIEESSAIASYQYDVGPVTVKRGRGDGAPAGFRFSYDATASYKFFGTCEEQPTDVVGWTSELILTRRR